jgi:molecular chaperone DnaJ
VQPGQQSGDQIRIPGWGIPEIGSGRVGDLIVVIRLETPRNLTKRQEELFRELSGLEEAEVSPQRRSFLDRIKDFFTGGEGEAAQPAPETEGKKKRGAK